jgi:hypothetical protein
LIGLTIIPSLITGGQPQARPEKTVSANLVLGSLPPTVDLEWDATKTVKDQWVGHSADDIVASALNCLKQRRDGQQAQEAAAHCFFRAEAANRYWVRQA